MYYIRKKSMNKGKRKIYILSIFLAVAVLLTLLPLLTLDAEAASEQVTITTLGELRDAVNTAPTDAVRIIQLDNDITLTGQALTVPVGAHIILSSTATDAYTLLRETAGRHFSVPAGASLQLDNITLSGSAPTLTIDHGGIEVLGTLLMNAGATIQGNRALNGAGVDVITSGSFTMTGGTIQANAAGNGGGGVRVSIGSEFTMEDGLITENTAHGAYGGGGVQVFGAIFTMIDGRIEANAAYDNGASYAGVGGGVAIHNQGAHAGEFTMSDDAVIHDNQAESGGGGVAITYNSTFFMDGGTISENITEEGGGAVFVSQGAFEMSDGIIEGNYATSGGGVWMWVGATFTMSGDAEISGNNAVNGGAVYVDVYLVAPGVTYADSLFTLTGGTISGNTATENGGGVFITVDNQFIMTGGTITDNTAVSGDGGGIFTQDHDYADPVSFLSAYTNITIENANIFGNSAGGGHFFPPSNASESPFGALLTNYEINFRGPYQAAQITFVLNGGNVDGDTADIVHSVPLGDNIGDLEIRPTPQRTGHTLIGWTLGDDSTILSTAEVDALDTVSGMVFTAQWQENSSGGGSGGGDGNGSGGGDATTHVHEWFMMGYPNGTFRPHTSITRAEVAAMLTRTMIAEYDPDLPAPAGLPFADVATNEWFYSYIAWGYAHDLILGYPDGTFRPNEPITRQELAAMITRASGAEIVIASAFPFPDANQIQPWARNYAYTAYCSGWMIGDAGTLTLRPLAAISRAETAAVFFRALERGATNMDSIRPVFDTLRIFPDVANQNSWYFFYVVEASHTHRYTMQDGAERWTTILWPLAH